MATPAIETAFYKSTHGRIPRGFGTWAFSPDPHCKIDQAFTFRGAYGQAAREARRHFRGKVRVIYPLT